MVNRWKKLPQERWHGRNSTCKITNSLNKIINIYIKKETFLRVIFVDNTFKKSILQSSWLYFEKNPYPKKSSFKALIKLHVKRITRNPNIVTKDQATHGCNNTCYSDKSSKVARIFLSVVTNSYPYCRHFCLLQLHQENDIRRSKKW